jgi:outer membrane protein assembly factor BamD (BamD/ComL family)
MTLRRKNKDDPQEQVARLYQQATRLYENGQYEDAIAIATQICKIIKQNFGENRIMLLF